MWWPVYEFRPIRDPSWFPLAPMYRYAEGEWVEDDGETFDLAFVIPCAGTMVYYAEPPYQQHIVWKWQGARGWGADDHRHPRGNAWHYMLRDGADEWGGPHPEREAHPNMVAYREAWEWARRHPLYTGATNGRSVEFELDERIIGEGLVRNRETSETLQRPDILNCMYCGPIDWRAERMAVRA